MKNILFILMLIVSANADAQEWNVVESSKFFAQGMLNIPQQEMIDLQTEMRQIPNLEVVRLDHNSNRFFILIDNMSSVSNEQLLNWFGEYAEFVNCVQIGVHGVDAVNSFPFVNCPN